MIDITQCIFAWVTCCRDVWERWFKDREDGQDEFIEVEEALFSALVLSAINMVERPILSDRYTLLTAVYKNNVGGYRSICKRQKAGNIYCESRVVRFESGASFPILSIDFMGTMLDGTPYAELKISDQEYILEPIDNLGIKINARCYKENKGAICP